MVDVKDEAAGDLLRRHQRTKKRPLALWSEVEELRRKERAYERLGVPFGVIAGVLFGLLGEWPWNVAIALGSGSAALVLFRAVIARLFSRAIERASHPFR